MANSYVEYSSGLTATTYSIPFNYIAIADVEVKGYNGSTWSDLTVASRDNAAKTITLSAAPSTYQKIRVWRNSSTAQLVDFQNGSRLSESDLDTAYQQGLFVAQEVSEGASTATAAGTVDVSLSGNTTVADLAITGTTTGLDVNGTDIILDADGDSKIEASADDVVAIHTGGSERLRVDDSGNVGIGTNDPKADLVVKQSGSTFTPSSQTVALFQRNTATGSGAKVCILSGNNTSGDLNFGDAEDEDIGRLRYEHNNNAMTFTTNTAERMRLTSGGYLALGNSLLPTNGTAGVTLAPEGNVHCGVATTASTNVMRFDNPNGRVGSISTTGSSTSYSTSSDYRLKENVTDVTDGITRVKQLAPKRFNFIADADTTVDGFIAHEAQAVVPESVTGTKDAVDDEGNPVMQGIDQAKLVPLLTAALQEAIAKIEVLETKVAALEA